ncbi:MAG: STAS domain-containing protein [Candidatus Marinimicrobia bacterium]|nr:STAS domain-containing protein [Candidatus Neomarinimicrobiota bacterium]
MQLKASELEGVYIVTIEGNVDTNSAPEVKSGLDKIINSGASKLILDLQLMDYISSAGLRILLITGKQLKGSNGELRLSRMNESVKDVFDISGFSSIFNIFDSVEDAQKDF